MVSKTRMLALVKDLQFREVAAGLDENPALLGFRDDRGRNWLHLCCGVNPKARRRQPSAAVKTADALLVAGLDLDRDAFREGAWKATPLWYAIARGENRTLARFLLEQGADPEHCLWAAAYRNDVSTIRLLASYGAEIDPVAEEATPFLFAVQWSRFEAAKALLELGADVDFRNAAGATALHAMLKKRSDPRHFRMLIQHGARGDIPNPEGVTAADIMARKRAPAFRKLAETLRQGG